MVSHVQRPDADDGRGGDDQTEDRVAVVALALIVAPEVIGALHVCAGRPDRGGLVMACKQTHRRSPFQFVVVGEVFTHLNGGPTAKFQQAQAEP